jgi:PRTRC genetic system protein C
MAVKSLTRVFKHNSNTLKDLDETLSPEAICAVYSNQFPELLNANIEGPEIVKDQAVYKFSKALGTKG